MDWLSVVIGIVIGIALTEGFDWYYYVYNPKKGVLK